MPWGRFQAVLAAFGQAGADVVRGE